jgi:hypothetical protein
MVFRGWMSSFGLRGSHGFVAALLVIGCGKLFDIDVPPESEPGGTGSALGGSAEDPGGNTSRGGTNPAGAAGSQSVSTGGRGTTSAGGAGGSPRPPASGGPSAGETVGPAGSHGSGEGGAQGDEGGAGAAGGPAPTVVFTRAGEPCERSGALSCVAPLSRRRNVCRGGVWSEQADLCPNGSSCDRRNGACQAIASECVGKQPGDTLCRPFPTDETTFLSQVTCGPDLVSVEVTDCDLTCNPELGRCVSPTSNQMYVEKPPPIRAVEAWWPNAPIRVCFEPGSDTALRAVVRAEIESTWGRYSALDFVGWDDCADESSSVKVHFEPVCTDVLGSIDRFGYPGPRDNTEVGLCLQYRQGARAAQSTTEPLLRLVARHEFGHVLGFEHLLMGDGGNEFFASVLRLTNLADMKFYYPHIGRLQWTYGAKPSGSLATYRGKCLDGELAFSSCAGFDGPRWNLLGNELEQTKSGQCLGTLESGAAIGLVTCDSAAAPAAASGNWRLSRVHVRAYGGLCLEEMDFGGGELGVPTKPCADFGYEKQLFDVEGVENGRKLRMRRGSLCIELDSTFRSPKLKPCDDCALEDPDCDALDRFELTSQGYLTLGGNCLRGPTFDWLYPEPEPGQVTIETCEASPPFRWNLSGVLQRDDGRTLTPTEGSGAELFTTGDLDSALTTTQVFDYSL